MLFRASYNNKEEVTPQILAMVNENFTWAANKSKVFKRLHRKMVDFFHNLSCYFKALERLNENHKWSLKRVKYFKESVKNY